MEKAAFNLPEIKHSKFNHEFQELCSQLEPIYGRRIWTLPYKAGCTEYKIKEAHRIAQVRNKLTFAYLYGILKKLP